jgi:cell wall assembly regulator SMI1
VQRDAVAALWGEIITWLRRNAPADAGRLRPPASASMISEVQAVVGFTLPDDLRQWWRQADGAVRVAAGYLMPWGFAPMSCRAALEDRAMRLQIAADLAADEEDIDDEETDEYESFGFQPHYLPIGHDHCGNCLYVDLRDGPEHGSIKFFDHEDFNPSGFHWHSITEMLTEIRDALIDDTPALRGMALRQATGWKPPEVYRATVTAERELCWVPEELGTTRSSTPVVAPSARPYDDALRRYRDLLAGPYSRITDAMSWSVITGQTDIPSVIRRLGGDPDTILEKRPIDDDGQPRWYLDTDAGTVMLLEVNGSQARRPAVLRRLSGRSNQMFSACWNTATGNAFSYAAQDEVVTQFDGRDPARRSGSEPDALAAEQEQIWAEAGGSWRAAMLALMESRTGIQLDAAWFEQPHPSVVTADISDGPSGTTLNTEIVALLCQKENPRRHTALAWLTQTLAERFDLNDPALLRAIEARRAHRRVDDETERQVRDMTRDLVRQALARDETTPQHPDPLWRRGQAASAAVKVLDFFDPSILVLHAENAFADDWHLIAAQLRARL